MANQSRMVLFAGVLSGRFVACLIMSLNQMQDADDEQQQQQPANSSTTDTSSGVGKAHRPPEVASTINTPPGSPCLAGTARQSNTTHGTRRASSRAPEGCCTTNPIVIPDDGDSNNGEAAALPLLGYNDDTDDGTILSSLHELYDDGNHLAHATPSTTPSMCMCNTPSSDATDTQMERETRNNSMVELWRYAQEDYNGH